MIVGQSEDTATKAPVQKAKRRKKDNSHHVNKWIHSDISPPTGFEWTLPDPVLEIVEPPTSLFEKFFTDDFVKFISEESIRYPISSSNINEVIKTVLNFLLFFCEKISHAQKSTKSTKSTKT